MFRAAGVLAAKTPAKDQGGHDPHSLLNDDVVRAVGKRASAAVNDIARLRFVRRSLAAHEAVAKRRSSAVYEARRRRYRVLWAGAALLLITALASVPQARRHVIPQATPASSPSMAAPTVPPKIWLVEQKAQFETYSNGLRIDNGFLVATHARSYRTFDRASLRPSIPETEPAGIVFHTTESRMAPFDPSQNSRLKRNGHELLTYVAANSLYHFLIDRFGRVFRVVAETDVANHAGHSLWADDRRIYWSLNQSFLGVAFEAQTGAEPGTGDIATPAQIDAARVLAEMLRAKYHITAADCVTHAQVSINVQSMRLGYHTDWADNFPFREIGLGDGYGRPVAALTLFGFDYDSAFLRANGGHVWQGLVDAEEQLVREAAAHGATFAQYRRSLEQKFRKWKARESGAFEEATGDR